MSRAFVLGAGGWGTALGLVLAEGFEQVDLWEHQAPIAAEMQAQREN